MTSTQNPSPASALALRYLVEKRGWTGAVVRTVSTTRMIDRLAKRYGLKLYETPVGFNHIADYMMKEDVLIGGEESGGISFKGHIPEGDGPIMGLLLVEMLAAADKPLYKMVDELLRSHFLTVQVYGTSGWIASRKDLLNEKGIYYLEITGSHPAFGAPKTPGGA